MRANQLSMFAQADGRERKRLEWPEAGSPEAHTEAHRGGGGGGGGGEEMDAAGEDGPLVKWVVMWRRPTQVGRLLTALEAITRNVIRAHFYARPPSSGGGPSARWACRRGRARGRHRAASGCSARALVTVKRPLARVAGGGAQTS